jgi:hypothetical protein
LPDVVTHRVEAIANASCGRRRRTVGRVHQEPEREVEEDADARWHQRQDDEDHPDKEGIDPEVDRKARANATEDAVRSTSQDAPRRLTHGPAIIAREL